MALEVGSRLGHYDVTALIGEGGMGQVYRIRDTKLDRDVALKVLQQAFTDDSDRLARFEREAKVVAALHNPSVGCMMVLEWSFGLGATLRRSRKPRWGGEVWSGLARFGVGRYDQR